MNDQSISKVVLFKEADAPPLPQGTVPVEVASSNERITTAEWLRWVHHQGPRIVPPLNVDIALDEELDQIAAYFIIPTSFWGLSTAAHTPWLNQHKIKTAKDARQAQSPEIDTAFLAPGFTRERASPQQHQHQH